MKDRSKKPEITCFFQTKGVPLEKILKQRFRAAVVKQLEKEQSIDGGSQR